MMSRPFSILFTALAFAIAPLHAAPAKSPPASVTYHIERHGPQVTVKDINEKTLVTCHATTPTLQCVITKNTLNGAITSNSKKTAHQPIFTLEDQNGRRLWSTLIPVISPTRFQCVFNVDFAGTKILFDNKPSDIPPSDQHQPEASRLFIILGIDGRPLSAGDDIGDKFALNSTGATLTEADGTVTKMQRTSNDGASIVSSDGNTGSVKTTDTGATLDFNGTKTVIKKVVKDGKTYSSFPWNGHKVLVEQPCTLGFTSDGDLTVNLPSPIKATAKK